MNSIFAQDGKSEITSPTQFSIERRGHDPKPRTQPPAPGAFWDGSLTFSYIIGGGFEDHTTQLEVTNLELVKEDGRMRMDESSVALNVDLRIFDETKSGKRDSAKATLFRENNKFSASDIRQLVLDYNSKSANPIENLDRKRLEFLLRFPGLSFSLSEGNMK